ncbi:hypothetical protein [Streptomyces sp. NPDC090026]
MTPPPTAGPWTTLARARPAPGAPMRALYLLAIVWPAVLLAYLLTR